MRFVIVSHHASVTNLALAAAAPAGIDAVVATPAQARELAEAGDTALGRLDVRPTCDGIEHGVLQLERLRVKGVTVLNNGQALLRAHDKLLTAAAFAEGHVPHPRTVHFEDDVEQPPLPFPFVAKPRFGSWGVCVELCRDAHDWSATLATFRKQPWFARTGALAQMLVPPRGYDLRLIVAGGAVVGAVKRVPRPGEWRTNVALGARREPVAPPPAARAVAYAAAAAVLGDLVGVDLLPVGASRFIALEVNGAAEFNDEYSIVSDVFRDAMRALVDVAAPERAEAVV
jgi:RimK family alpha-L-glutamate ligase